jgi:hypothetical protein
VVLSAGCVCDFGLLCGGNGKPNAVVEQLCWNSGSVRDWQVTPLAADLVPGISHVPRPSLWGFPMPTLNRLVFLRSSTRNGINSRTAVYGPVRTVVFLWADWPTDSYENLCTMIPARGGKGRCHTG